MHARHYQDSNPNIPPSVEQGFYVDNFLESLPNIPARDRVDQLRSLLAEGGFEFWQGASNRTEVAAHLLTR